jgi:LysM repeat protein
MKTMGNKFMKHTSFVFIFLLSFSLYGQNQDKAIDFIIGSEAFQKMEFAYSNTKAGKEYVKYLFKVSENETIIFDIGVETDLEILATKPSNALLFTPDMWVKQADTLKENIIAGNQNLRLILPVGINQFRIAPVYSIEWIRHQDNKCEFRSSDLEFILDLSRDVILASDNFLLQKISDTNIGNCKAYTLRKNSKLQATIYKDIIWTPKLGVIKESFSGNQGEYTLLRIQGISYNDYMANLCINKMVVNQNDNNQEILRSKGLATSNTGERFHIVEKGETFFGIAKKYNVLPGNLMDYNQTVDPNKMNVGLIIKIPAEKNVPTIPSGTYILQEGDNIEKIALTFGITHQDISHWNPEFNKKVVGDIIFIKAPVNDTTNEGVRTKGANITVDNKPKTIVKTQWWETTDGKHVVKANENVSMLATAYGFTEERFRQMNGLLPNEKIKEGQQLITVICPVPNTIVAPNKVSTENQKAIKVAAEAETKQVENKPEENTPYFDIQNGKMKSLFSEPEIISPETDNQKTIKGSSSQREIYIVQQGDTVVGIATKFNLSETKLRELNKLAAGEVVIPRQRIFLN